MFCSTLNTNLEKVEAFSLIGTKLCKSASKWIYGLIGLGTEQFTIREISREQFPSIAKIVRQWQTFSDEKEYEINKCFEIEGYPSKRLYDLFRKLRRAEIQPWHNSSLISKLVAQCFEFPNDTLGRVYTHAYACYQNEKMQGVLLLREENSDLKIAHVVSNPENIESPFNLKTYKVRGVGTALVEFTKRRCIELGKISVYIEGIKGVHNFYEKLGFKDDDGAFIEDGKFSMQWENSQYSSPVDLIKTQGFVRYYTEEEVEKFEWESENINHMKLE